MFFDRPLVPRSKEDLEAYLQFGPKTSEAIKALTKIFRNVPYIKEVANPAKIQNMILGYTGGLGRLGVSAIDNLLEAFGVVETPPDPSMTLADIPGIRGFIQRFPTSTAASIEIFYKRYLEDKRKWDSKKEEMGVRGKGPEISKAIAEMKPKQLVYYETVAKVLSAARAAAKGVYESPSMTPEAKKDALDNVYTMMADMARQALGKQPIEAWVQQYGSRPPVAERIFNEIKDIKKAITGKKEIPPKRPPGIGTLGERARLKPKQRKRSPATKKDIKKLLGR